MIPSWATLGKVIAILAALIGQAALPGGTALMVAAGIGIGVVVAGFVWASLVRRVEGPTVRRPA